MGIGRELESLGQLLRQSRSRCMEQFGLKSTQVQILLAVGKEPGISQDRLAVLVGVDKSNIARQLAILEEMDYVTRTPAPGNRRMFRLYLKERAQRILPRMEKAETQWEDALLQDLSRWEISQLSAFLDRIRQSAEEA